MSNHNLCFGAKFRKKVYPCKPQFYEIKVGSRGVFVTRTCSYRYFCSLFVFYSFIVSFSRVTDEDSLSNDPWSIFVCFHCFERN